MNCHSSSICKQMTIPHVQVIRQQGESISRIYQILPYYVQVVYMMHITYCVSFLTTHFPQKCKTWHAISVKLITLGNNIGVKLYNNTITQENNWKDFWLIPNNGTLPHLLITEAIINGKYYIRKLIHQCQ